MVVRAAIEMSEDRKAKTPKVTDTRASIRYFDREHCIAWHGSVQLILSTVPPTMPVMTEIVEQLEKLAAMSRGGTGCLLVIRSDVSPPAEDVRRFIRMKLEKSSMLAAAQVVLGTGFRGAAMRSMLSLLQMAIRPSYAMRIFGDVRAGSQWLTEALLQQGSRASPAEDLITTAEELSAQFF